MYCKKHREPETVYVEMYPGCKPKKMCVKCARELVLRQLKSATGARILNATETRLLDAA